MKLFAQYTFPSTLSVNLVGVVFTNKALQMSTLGANGLLQLVRATMPIRPISITRNNL
jgi:hypothetical protein